MHDCDEAAGHRPPTSPIEGGAAGRTWYISAAGAHALDSRATVRLASSATLDLTSLKELDDSDGAECFIRELIEMFIEDVPRRLASLRSAMLDGNLSALKETAHALKGMCATQGAQRMTVLCEFIEECALKDKPGGADALLEELAREFERVRRALNEQYPAGVS